MSEFTLTKNDYAEIALFSIEELKSGISEILDDLYYYREENDVRPTLSLQGRIEEACLWLKAYEDELAKKTVIITPKCQGCKDGALNQLGHIGPNGCLDDPGFE